MSDPESTVINPSVKPKDPKEALVIAVTTRAIFNLEKEHEIFLTKGKDEYVKHQRENENNSLEQGTAFAFVQAVQFVNKKLLERNPEEKKLFDVIVLSNNSPESGTRIINSAKQHVPNKCVHLCLRVSSRRNVPLIPLGAPSQG